MMFAAPFPLLNLWVRDLGISRTQGGSLTGLWYLVSACASLPAGWLADRIRLRGLFLSLWTLVVAGPKLLAVWFEGRREFGLIMGFYSMSMSAGVYASLFVLGRIGQRSGWR